MLSFGGMKYLICCKTKGYTSSRVNPAAPRSTVVVEALPDFLGAIFISKASKQLVTVMEMKTRPVDLTSTLEIRIRNASRMVRHNSTLDLTYLNYGC